MLSDITYLGYGVKPHDSEAEAVSIIDKHGFRYFNERQRRDTQGASPGPGYME